MSDESATSTNSEQRLFDLRAAVAYLHSIGATSATLNFVRGLVSAGEVSHVRIGKKFHVSRASLDRWIENHDRRRR